MQDSALKSNYRSLLRHHIIAKQKKNPQLSLRSIAKTLGVSPSTLSEVLSGKKNLSVTKAFAIAKNLKFSKQDLERFVHQVEIEQTKNPELKQYLMGKMTESKGPIYDVSVDHFQYIAQWYHLPLLQMLRVNPKNFSPLSAAQKLGITTLEAQDSLDRLERLDLIEKTKTGYRVVTATVLVESKTPNTALRMYHKQMLTKGIEALHEQSPQEKWMGSETIAFDPIDLEKVDQILNRAFLKIVNIAKNGKDRSEIYHLAALMFRLTKGK